MIFNNSKHGQEYTLTSYGMAHPAKTFLSFNAQRNRLFFIDERLSMVYVWYPYLLPKTPATDYIKHDGKVFTYNTTMSAYDFFSVMVLGANHEAMIKHLTYCLSIPTDILKGSTDDT